MVNQTCSGTADSLIGVTVGTRDPALTGGELLKIAAVGERMIPRAAPTRLLNA